MLGLYWSYIKIGGACRTMKRHRPNVIRKSGGDPYREGGWRRLEPYRLQPFEVIASCGRGYLTSSKGPMTQMIGL